MNPSIHPLRSDVRRLLIIVSAVLLISIGLLLVLALLGPVAGEVRVLPAVSLTEAQQQLPFTIPQPQWLPEGLTLKGAHVDPPNWVNIFYRRINDGAGGLGIETTRGPREGGYAYPDTAKQPITVHGQSAICVQGAWNERGEWIALADAGALEWSANGFFYHISHSDLGLTCADLIRIAELLQ